MSAPVSYDHMLVHSVDPDLGQIDGLVQWVFPKSRMDDFKERLIRQKKDLEEIVSYDHLPREFPKSVATICLYSGLQKIDGVVSWVSDQLERLLIKKLVIFAWNRDVMNDLRRKLSVYHPITLYEGTPSEKRQRHIDKFQSFPKFKVFIANIKTTLIPIDLSAAQHILFIEPSWNPEDNVRAALCCCKSRQTKPVMASFVVTKTDLLDQKISASIMEETITLLERGEKHGRRKGISDVRSS